MENYRIGKIPLGDNHIYVMYLNGTPAAAYVAAAGEYDAYYDFIYNYCGSPMWDVVEGITYERFMSETYPVLIEEYDGRPLWNPVIVEIHVTDEYALDKETGLSVHTIRERALQELFGYAFFSYETDPKRLQKRQDIVNDMLELLS